jgi:hypothetical protein
VCGWILFFLSFLLMLVTFPISVWMCLKVMPPETSGYLPVNWQILRLKVLPYSLRSLRSMSALLSSDWDASKLIKPRDQVWQRLWASVATITTTRGI